MSGSRLVRSRLNLEPSERKVETDSILAVAVQLALDILIGDEPVRTGIPSVQVLNEARMETIRQLISVLLLEFKQI